MNNSNETTEGADGDPAPMMMNLPSSLGNIDEDDISLPLSLIKGLRRKSLDPSMASTNAMDSSTSSNNTSDKDDSGGDEEGGSNTSSTSKANDMVGTLSVGQISSLSGSEQESSNRGRVGILRVGGGNGNAGFSSSSDENITGDDELSEKVVVHGKSVTSSQQQEQVQYKVSFAEGHCSKKSQNGSSDEGAAEEAAHSPKRKRGQEKYKSSSIAVSSSSSAAGKRQKTSDPEEFKNNSISFPVSDSSGNEGNNVANGHEQQHEQRNGGAPSRAVSSTSSTTGSSGQDAGQASSSSPLYSQTDDPMEQDKAAKTDPSLSSPQLTSQNDSSKFATDKSPSSPSKEQTFQDSEERRRERNQREKERSNKIASQVDTLRCLLQRGGLFIPKKTKSSVLSEASNYIKTLQDRQQMMNMEMENLKCQLVNAMAAREQQQVQMQANAQVQGSEQDYRLIFKNTVASMCVASMGGALLDCNAAFEKETGFSQGKLGEMTIFNMIHASDLQRALDLISRMIDTGFVQGSNGNQAAPQAPQPHQDQEPLLLQSSFANRPDLGLCVTLVRGTDTLPKCFSVTLVKNVGSGTNNDNPPFNPTLPAIPSMPQDVGASKGATTQQATTYNSQVPAAPSVTAPVLPVNKMPAQAVNGIAMNNASVAPALANQVQGHTVGVLSIPPAVAPQAPLALPQPTAAAAPSSQLLHLLLLQQMQQGGGQQAPLAQQQVQQVPQLPPQLQQYQNQVQPQVPLTAPAWNAQNLAMLPQFQQILRPPGSNSSSQGSDDGNQTQGLVQNQALLQATAAPAPQYLNVQNLPAMLPQIQQMLKPPDSNNGSSQGSKNSGDEGDNNRPWYYAG